jgi:phosphoglycolate phosphatase-like HAD superfamily hydrolase
MKCKYRTIIFDFDGVIVESAGIKTNAYAELYKEYGHTVVEQVVKYNSVQGGLSRFEHFRYFHQEILKKDLSQKEEIRLAERFSQLVVQAVISAPLVSGVMEFLDTYRKIIDFYIASGTPEEELQRIADIRGIAHYFKGIYGAPQTKASIITNILSHSGLRAEEVLMIGDSMTDYEGAITAGIPFVGRIAPDQENFFPTSIMKIKDFKDKTALHHVLFQQGV